MCHRAVADQRTETTALRLAVLASSKVERLPPAIRVGGMRRDPWIEMFTPDSGQSTQALADPG